jgi:hypothetical protein
VVGVSLREVSQVIDDNRVCGCFSLPPSRLLSLDDHQLLYGTLHNLEQASFTGRVFDDGIYNLGE